MTSTRFTLDDLGGALSWRALLHFVGNLPPTSALMREADPDAAGVSAWMDGTMTAPLLADLIDCLNVLRWESLASRTQKGKRKPRLPEPVPRPWAKGRKAERRIGRDPIPVSKFDEWWERRG